MPERSEWLVAGGGAKRNPRYRGSHHDASERRENRLPRRLLSRLSDAFLYGACIPGVALTLNPRLRALGLRPRHSTLQVGWHPLRLVNNKHKLSQIFLSNCRLVAKYGHKKGTLGVAPKVPD